MIHLLTIGALLTPIRLYSTNWRNSDDILVKQVIYDPILRLKEFRPSEHNDMTNLPKGFVYDAKLENDTIVYYSRNKTL